MLSNIGARIRRLREQKGWTQKELAKLAGYKSDTSIAKIEVGKVDLPQSKIKAFADLFEVSPAYILGSEQNSGGQPAELGRDALIDDITQKFSKLPEDVKAQVMAYADFLLSGREPK